MVLALRRCSGEKGRVCPFVDVPQGHGAQQAGQCGAHMHMHTQERESTGTSRRYVGRIGGEVDGVGAASICALQRKEACLLGGSFGVATCAAHTL